MHMRRLAGLALLLAFAGLAFAEVPPSKPAVDAPELAKLGAFGVGHSTLTLPSQDSRNLVIELWYPATVPAGAAPLAYSGSFTAEPPAAPTKFTRPGIAVRDAAPEVRPVPPRHRFARL